MSEIKDHRGLEAWKVAMDAVMETYAVSSDFPKAEINQLGIALGSIAEVDTQLEVARRLAYVSRDRAAHLQELIVSSRRLVNGLRRARRLKLGRSVGVPVGLLLLTFRLFA